MIGASTHKNAHMICSFFVMFFANSFVSTVPIDHLLSYFLGANEGGTNDNNIPESDIAVEKNPDNIEAAASVNFAPANVRPASQPSSHINIAGVAAAVAAAAGITGPHQTQHPSLENFVHSRARESSGGLSTTSSSAGLPPTPSVHFYDGHHSSGGQHPLPPIPVIAASIPAHSSEYNSFVQPSQLRHASSSSLQNRSGSHGSMHKVPSRTSTTSTGSTNSSASSLTNMAAALALGVPNQVMFMQQKLQSRDQMTGVPINHHNSNALPITPVMGMGSPSGYEMMMLPPPPRFPNGMTAAGGVNPGQMMQQQQMNVNMQQQQQMNVNMQQHQNIMHQQQQSQQQLQIPQVVQSSNYAAAQQQQPNFLPQMNPPSIPAGTGLHPPQPTHIGFPDPNSVTNAVLAQQQQLPQPHELLHQQGVQLPAQTHQQMQHSVQHPQQQQIQIGLSGQTIPITAVPGADGQVHYQIDPSVVPTSGLRYFTKAINEVTKPAEVEDPMVAAEKRQQRLARNRQSARQSRRRKKDHLSTMGTKVRSLQRQLDTELRAKCKSMEVGLVRQRGEVIEKWIADEQRRQAAAADSKEAIAQSRMNLAEILQKAGPNCPIRLAVASHQYHCLRQAFLSTHNRYALWMMMQSSPFFTEASNRRHNSMALAKQKEQQENGETGNDVSEKKTTIGTRANSKQVGEELYNTEKKSGNGVTCQAGDELRNWPLYCNEIGMTMEQEDRIINQAHSQ